jgi:hypothetical protein
MIKYGPAILSAQIGISNAFDTGAYPDPNLLIAGGSVNWPSTIIIRRNRRNFNRIRIVWLVGRIIRPHSFSVPELGQP